MKQKLFAIFPAALFAALFAVAAPAAADTLRAGEDYIALDPPQPERVESGKIEVIEFFNFSCPHCFRLQKPFREWQKGLEESGDFADIAIVHQPVVFQRAGGHYARIFYTLDALGIAAEFAPKVYRAMHSERKLINSESRFLNWLEDEGVDRARAEKVFNSFSVSSKTRRADSLVQEYGVNSTPQIGIAGKYIVNASLAGSYEKMLQTATALIERERKLRAKKAL